MNIEDVLTEVKGRLNTVSDLQGRSVIAYDIDSLLDSFRTIQNFPGIGIIYDGMRSLPSSGASMKPGVSAEMVISLVMIFQGEGIQKNESQKTTAIHYLSEMRAVFLGKKSTTSLTLWHFMSEAPAIVKAGMSIWVQRWVLPVPLASGPIQP